MGQMWAEEESRGEIRAWEGWGGSSKSHRRLWRAVGVRLGRKEFTVRGGGARLASEKRCGAT